MCVFDDLPQLVEDQIRLEFQRGRQGMGNGQERILLMGTDIDPPLEILFSLGSFADIPDNTQQTHSALIRECCPAPFGVKHRAILAYVKDASIEHSIRLKRPDVLAECALAVGVYKTRQGQSDEFLEREAMHQACCRIGFYHQASFQIVDDQAIGGGIEDASILPFIFSLVLFGSFAY